MTPSKSLPLLLLFVLLFTACNRPVSSDSAPSAAGAIYTAAAQTVQAKLTVMPAGTLPAFQTTATVAPPIVSAPTATLAPTVSGPACEMAAFVSDISVPDDTPIEPGAPFTKTWRLRNSGTCAWQTPVQIVFDHGERMGAPDAIPLSAPVAAGQTIDLTIPLTAPAQPGTYRADFKLRNASGQTFGIGEEANSFWVQIKVGAGGQSGGEAAVNTPGYDFLTQSFNASWTSGVGTAGASLAFGGSENDPNGAAAIKENVLLETGLTSGKLLLTVPRQENDGFVLGVFPSYQVRRNDQFQARVGFLAGPTGQCSSSQVVFQFGYLENGNLQVLGEWDKSCSGKLLPIEVDLSSLRGQTVQFAFRVLSDGPAQGDFAIWNSPQIKP